MFGIFGAFEPPRKAFEEHAGVSSNDLEWRLRRLWGLLLPQPCRDWVGSLVRRRRGGQGPVPHGGAGQGGGRPPRGRAVEGGGVPVAACPRWPRPAPPPLNTKCTLRRGLDLGTGHSVACNLPAHRSSSALTLYCSSWSFGYKSNTLQRTSDPHRQCKTTHACTRHAISFPRPVPRRAICLPAAHSAIVVPISVPPMGVCWAPWRRDSSTALGAAVQGDHKLAWK